MCGQSLFGRLLTSCVASSQLGLSPLASRRSSHSAISSAGEGGAHLSSVSSGQSRAFKLALMAVACLCVLAVSAGSAMAVDPAWDGTSFPTFNVAFLTLVGQAIAALAAIILPMILVVAGLRLAWRIGGFVIGLMSGARG